MPEDQEEALKKLELQNKALEEKNRSLAKIIEISANNGPKAEPVSPDAKPRTDSETQQLLEELQNSMKTVKKTLKESVKGPAEKHEEMKKMVSDIEAKIKEVEKIPSMETKMAEIEKRISDDAQKQSNPLGGLFGGFGSSGPGAGAPKNAPKNMRELMKLINDSNDALENRLLNMERRIDSIRKKIGDKNLERLEGLISSKQDISDNIVPRRVKEEVEKILSAFSFEVEGMAKSARELSDSVEKSNEEIEESLKVITDLKERVPILERAISDMQNRTQDSEEKLKELSDASDMLERFKNELQESTLKSGQRLDSLSEKSEDMERSIEELESATRGTDQIVNKLSETVDYMEKAMNEMRMDYKLKSVLRSELSRIAPKAPKKRRKSRRRPGRKAEADKTGKETEIEGATPEEKRELEKMIHKMDEEQKDKISSIMGNIKAAYKGGLITKARYERISKKLDKLKKSG
jgi:DNA repair exonuclease SbcCD ATPase subunit